MQPTQFNAEGEIAADRPQVRLAALRLAELARDVRGAVLERPRDKCISEVPFVDWMEGASRSAHSALQRISHSFESLAERLLLANSQMTVRDVDAVVALLREDMLALLALRDSVVLRSFPDATDELVDRAERAFGSRLADFGRICDVLADMIRSAIRDGAGSREEVSIALDMDLAHELRVIASEARGAVPFWKFC